MLPKEGVARTASYTGCVRPAKCTIIRTALASSSHWLYIESFLAKLATVYIASIALGTVGEVGGAGHTDTGVLR